MTWTLLIWTAQAAFDLFVWVLLVVLYVTRRHGARHDRSPDAPSQDCQTIRLE